MFPTTYDSETELSAVNTILGSLGQTPVTVLDFENPEINLVYRTLQDTNNQCQAEGWVFNTEREYPLVPDQDGEIEIPQNVLQMDLSYSEGPWMDVVKRNGKLYDKLAHTYTFTRPIKADIVWKFAFEDLPHPFKQYITYRAARICVSQLMGDKELYSLLQEREGVARAVCMEYECNQGDYNFLGYPDGTRGNNYRPYQALIR